MRKPIISTFLGGLLFFTVVIPGAIASPDEYKAFQQAQQLSAKGDTSAAIKIYQSIIKSNPANLVAYNNLAVLQAKQGELELASKTLEQGLKLTDPQVATTYQNLQTVLVEMARDSYAKALQVDVKSSPVKLQTLTINQAPVQLASSESNTASHDTSSDSLEKTEPEISIEPVVEKSPVAPSQSASQVRGQKTVAVNLQETLQKVEASAREVQQAGVKQEITDTVLGWATAWSAQDVDLYLSFYAESFNPGDGSSREDWAKQRKYRLRKPQWVKVDVSDISMLKSEDDTVQVEFMQRYRSDTYQDQGRKQLVMQQSAEGWRILTETSL